MFHFYSLTKPTLLNEPWIKGMLYLFPAKSFTYVGKGALQFSEWVSYETVSPVAKSAVEPSDFYFLHKVAAHRANEAVSTSWLLYKLRTLLK